MSRRHKKKFKAPRPTLPGGVSEAARRLRYDLMGQNVKQANEAARTSPHVDPVVILVDVRDGTGRQFARAVEEYQRDRGETPTLTVEQADAKNTATNVCLVTVVVSIEHARELLSITSDTAIKHLNTERPAGHYWLVCVAANGNSYAAMPLIKEGIKVGHHRDGGPQ
jgi:hypothetical protein